MAYKDKDKQREAQREWVRQKRLKEQGSTKRGKDIKCFADLPRDVQQTIERVSRINNNEAEYKTEKAKRTASAIRYQHLFPERYGADHLRGYVTGKPGDADYNGICTDEWRAERGR